MQHTSNPLDVDLEALSLELAKGSNQCTACKVRLVLARATNTANHTVGGDGNVGEGEEDITLLARLCGHRKCHSYIQFAKRQKGMQDEASTSRFLPQTRVSGSDQRPCR